MESDNRLRLPRVLIVDENTAQRRLARRYLWRWGYSVAEASTYADALHQISEDQFGIVIVNCDAAGISGTDLCQKIRKRDHPDYCYVILLTSSSDSNAVLDAMNAGADDFLTKPFNQMEIKSRLIAACRILNMDQSIKRKSFQVEAAYRELRLLYSDLEKDLVEAGKFQNSLVPASYEIYDWGNSLTSTGHADMLGAIWLDIIGSRQRVLPSIPLMCLDMGYPQRS